MISRPGSRRGVSEALPSVSLIPRATWGPKDALKAVGAVAAALFAAIVAITAGLAFGPFDGGSETVLAAATLTISLVVEAAMIVAVLWFAVRRRGASWTSLGFRRPNASRMLVGVPATLFAAFFVVALFSYVVFELGLRDPGDTVIPPALLSGSLLLALFLTSVVVAPVAEETFFRGFLYGGLRGSWGPVRGGAVSAGLFGLAHPDLFLIVPVTLLGALLVWLYAWTGSLWGPIAVHAMFNALQLLPELLSESAA